MIKYKAFSPNNNGKEAIRLKNGLIVKGDWVFGNKPPIPSESWNEYYSNFFTQENIYEQVITETVKILR